MQGGETVTALLQLRPHPHRPAAGTPLPAHRARGLASETALTLPKVLAVPRLGSRGSDSSKDKWDLIRKDFFAEGAVGRWNGLPRAGVESPSLEGLKSGVDPALRDLVELRTVRVRFMVGLDDLQGLFQPR